MKIVIDARMIHHGGIGTYIRGLLPHFTDCGHEVIPLFPEQFKTPIYSASEQIQFLQKIPRCDLFWSPHFNIPFLPVKAKRRAVTIHDLFHLDHLEQFSPVKKLYAKLALRKATLKSDLIITVSEFSKMRLLHYFPVAEAKIHVIHSGCDHLSSLDSEPVEELPSSFFLLVGNGKPHKNLQAVLKAMEHFPEMQLVITGKKEKHPRVHSVGRVSDGKLKWLYVHAQALIFPSLYEGWGLPPLEAMSLGCPVIASSAASIPEACGRAPLYFDPSSAQELCVAIEKLSSVREECVQKGYQRAGELTWEEAAKKHLQLFSTVATLP
ncbi:MAG: D-inositol-3-phosphate glycosyltransferase [Chlamydiae bacterium]|nr:D-inositol-3-phosphate glycosyltransferase [Chlamydiota bacterium]